MANQNELLGQFEQKLLESEWEQVNVEYPAVATLIQQMVEVGITPAVISGKTVQVVGTTRTGMARRLENAAKYWHNQRKPDGVQVAKYNPS